MTWLHLSFMPLFEGGKTGPQAMGSPTIVSWLVTGLGLEANFRVRSSVHLTMFLQFGPQHAQSTGRLPPPPTQAHTPPVSFSHSAKFVRDFLSFHLSCLKYPRCTRPNILI